MFQEAPVVYTSSPLPCSSLLTPLPHPPAVLYSTMPPHFRAVNLQMVTRPGHSARRTRGRCYLTQTQPEKQEDSFREETAIQRYSVQLTYPKSPVEIVGEQIVMLDDTWDHVSDGLRCSSGPKRSTSAGGEVGT
jgi:hypothetical protein